MAVDPQIIESLRRLGLNQYEAKAYGALCSHGSQTVGMLSERADVPRARSYDVLMSLQEKGFVSMQQGRPVRYSAMPLDEAVVTLRKQKQASLFDELQKIEEISKSLSSKLKPVQTATPPSEERVWTLKGRDAIYSRMGSMIVSSKKVVHLASHANGFERKFKAHQKDLVKAKTRGVKLHFYSPSVPGDAAELADQHVDVEHPSRMLVTDKEALLFLTAPKTPADEEVALWVKSPHVVETLQNALKA
ncbi:TrmB family transcriptional regulator [Candidatus Micrarchaeota archaeon]|nr:TrmB family transcriptional regulator [Candidatus Micrarchaeota archaeon]